MFNHISVAIYSIINCLIVFIHARIQEYSSGGGGPGQSHKKALTTFFLDLSLFYRSQMVNFKENYHFSRFQRGFNIFQGGGPTYSRGGGGLIAYSL